MTHIEYVWDWDDFMKPDTHAETFSGVTSQKLRDDWMKLLAQYGVTKPKYFISFRATREETLEIQDWMAENLPHAFRKFGAAVVENDNDLMLIKMVWG